MTELTSAGRLLPVGPDSLRQRKGIDQEQFGELLDLLCCGLVRVLVVRCLVTIKANQMRPVAHCWREDLLFSECGYARGQRHPIRGLGTQPSRGAIDHFAKHHHGAGERPGANVPCRLSEIRGNSVGHVIGTLNGLRLRVLLAHLEPGLPYASDAFTGRHFGRPAREPYDRPSATPPTDPMGTPFTETDRVFANQLEPDIYVAIRATKDSLKHV